MALPTDHNTAGIRHKTIRIDADADAWHREFHDAVTAAHRKGSSWAVGPHVFDFSKRDAAAQELFNTLHGLIGDLYILRFHAVNIRQDPQDIVPLDEYDVYDKFAEGDGLGSRRTDALLRIQAARTWLIGEGYDVPTGWALAGTLP